MDTHFIEPSFAAAEQLLFEVAAERGCGSCGDGAFYSEAFGKFWGTMRC